MGATAQVMTRGLEGVVLSLQPLQGATESTLGYPASPNRCGRTPECHVQARPGLCFLGNLEVGSTGLAVPARLSGPKTAILFSRRAASAARRCAIRFPSGLKPRVASEVFYGCNL